MGFGPPEQSHLAVSFANLHLIISARRSPNHILAASVGGLFHSGSCGRGNCSARGAHRDSATGSLVNQIENVCGCLKPFGPLLSGAFSFRHRQSLKQALNKRMQSRRWATTAVLPFLFGFWYWPLSIPSGPF
jgi:hypothetical protein